MNGCLRHKWEYPVQKSASEEGGEIASKIVRDIEILLVKTDECSKTYG